MHYIYGFSLSFPVDGDVLSNSGTHVCARARDLGPDSLGKAY